MITPSEKNGNQGTCLARLIVASWCTMGRCFGYIYHLTLMMSLFPAVVWYGNRFKPVIPSTFGRFVLEEPPMELFRLLPKSCMHVGRRIKMRLPAADWKTSTPANASEQTAAISISPIAYIDVTLKPANFYMPLKRH